ncbi:hypothetical protein LINPERHAP1_LOCUS5410 [Linum perenne]
MDHFYMILRWRHMESLYLISMGMCMMGELVLHTFLFPLLWKQWLFKRRLSMQLNIKVTLRFLLIASCWLAYLLEDLILGLGTGQL